MAAYLLRHLEKASSLLSEGSLSLFLDYDGTLTGIAGRPEEAHLQARTVDALEALSKRFPLAVVSGRSLADIKAMVGIDSIVYAGNHGLEISSPYFSMTYDIGPGPRAALEGLRPALAGLEETFSGVLVEDKDLTLTVHYRLMDPGLFDEFKEALGRCAAAAASGGHVRLTHSRKAFELRANVGWDKGRAVQWLMDRPLFKGKSPLYMGDDDTDVDAYRSISAKGISVNVGRAVEEAGYFLMYQKEVEPFLKWLARSRPSFEPSLPGLTFPSEIPDNRP